MKTERRHELQTNTLAQHLAIGIERIKPYVNHILLGVAAVAVLLIAVAVFRGQEHAKQASAWEAYFLATTESPTSADTEQERLRKAVENFGGSRMAEWAQLTIADENLQQGAVVLGTDRSTAKKNINSAITEYRILVDSSTIPAVRDLANFNLGVSHEMLGELDKAVEAYGKVGGTLAEMAKKRSEDLEKNQELREFYDWYAKAEPKRPLAGGLEPGKTPEFDPGEPGLKPFGDLPSSKPAATGEIDLPELFPDRPDLKKPNPTPPLPEDPTPPKSEEGAPPDPGVDGKTTPADPAASPAEKPSDDPANENPAPTSDESAPDKPTPEGNDVPADKPADEPASAKKPE